MTHFVLGTITKIEERFTKRHVLGFGKDAVFDDVSAGWWIVVGSVSMYVGDDNPDCAVGDVVELTIRKNGQALGIPHGRPYGRRPIPNEPILT